MAVILFNAVLFGLQTSPCVVSFCGSWLSSLDSVCLVVFTIELALKLIVYRHRYFCDPWNVFDFLVVAVAYVPEMGMFSSIRLFRVLRVFKVISGVRQMRVILTAIVKSLPGVGWASFLLALVYYVYGIVATYIFGARFPDWFGSLGRSVYSLFQVMTLESWSMGIARPVIAEFPYAWVFFVSYILISSFIVMNVVVGIVLTSIDDSCKEDAAAKKSEGDATKPDLKLELEKLRQQMAAVEAALEAEYKKGKSDEE